MTEQALNSFLTRIEKFVSIKPKETVLTEKNMINIVSTKEAWKKT